jgi:hypothetical protein
MSDIVKAIAAFVFFLCSATFVGAWVGLGFYVARRVVEVLL